MINRRAVIIFSGYNQRAVIAFIRTLERHNIEYGIIANGDTDSIYRSKYAKKVKGKRQLTELNAAEIFSLITGLQNAMGVDEYLLSPSSESFNRFFLRNREQFIALKIKLPLVDQRLYETISDKWKFRSLCLNSGIVVPREYLGLSGAKLPCVAKPKSYFNADGSIHVPIFIKDEQDRARFFEDFDESDFYFQVFVGGESYYLLYYFDEKGEVTKYSQKNLIQQPGGKSIVFAMSSSIHRDEISDRYERLLGDVSFRGLIMVEIKYDKGEYYMIEANPRFWGPSQLFIDAGVNLFEALLVDFGYLEEVDNRNVSSEVVYHWFGGSIPYLAEASPLTYYSFDLKEYMRRLPSLIEADVYRRGDSLGIYEKEFNVIK